MGIRIRVLLVLLTVVLGASACATSRQWAEASRHPSWFASWDHLRFSLAHQGHEATPRVTQTNVQEAKSQSWWGDPVAVRPDQVIGRVTR